MELFSSAAESRVPGSKFGVRLEPSGYLLSICYGDKIRRYQVVHLL